MGKRSVPLTFEGKNTKLSTYVNKIAKSVSDSRPAAEQFTMSAQALTEVELLIKHAVHIISQNTSSILQYSGAATVGLKTVEVATKVGFYGNLSKEMALGGQAAIDCYLGNENSGVSV